MSFLPRSATLFAVGVSLSIGIASVTFGGCSGSDDSPSGGGTDSNTDASTSNGGGGGDGSTTNPGSDGSAPLDCSSACDKKFPDAGPKIDALDSCWTAKCNDPCVNGVEPDGGELNDDAGTASCTTTVDTGGVSCNACTSQNCCTEWDTCAGDPSCVGLIACYSACP